MQIFAWFSRRYLDLLASIYIYNEHRGYTALQGLVEVARSRWPDDRAFIAAVEKHQADERKHYLMFRHWFQKRGQMPLCVDRTCGHIDRFVEIMFGTRIDALDRWKIVDDTALFERLCRVISLTERRGFRQVETLLGRPIVRSDSGLMKIFKVIEKDEPSHWAPYDKWLKQNHGRKPSWWEHLLDTFIHSELILLKLPILFLNPALRRRTEWPDAADHEAASDRRNATVGPV